jgi:hypothetical protein
MAKRRKKAHHTKAAGTTEARANATHTPAKVHSFSRTIAQEHGEKAAVLLQYLAHHVSKSKHLHDGRKWFYKTLDDLAAVFPYLKRSTIHDTLQKLGKANGPLLIGAYNKKGYDRTCWYAFRDDNLRKAAQSSKPVYFRVEDAVKHGIVAAVLLGNLEHWIKENRKQDPQYTWHQILPGELVEHLPFSKSTMQRALRTLVTEKVLKIKATPEKGETAEYALVDESRLKDSEEGGPNPDMRSGSISDEGGSKSDMPGSKPDMGGSFSDMGGSNPDNNTILIDPHLEEPCLKEPGYVEPGLPNPVTTTPKTDKLKAVKDVHPFAGIVRSAPDTPKSMTRKSQKSRKSATSSGSDAVSSAEATVPASPASPPTSEPASAAPAPGKTTRVKLSKVLEDRFYKNTRALDKMPSVTAESAVTLAFDWITRFFHDTKAEELAEFFRIGDQETLYDKLADFFAPHLVKHLERFTNTPERKLLAHFTSQLVMQFLTQAFCGYQDYRYEFTNARHSKKVCVMLGQKLNPFWDELEKKQGAQLKAQQNAILKVRAEKYASPDRAKETRADLSAAEKVQVLRNSLAARNNVGAFDEQGQLQHQVLEYNNRTFDAAYEFFQANPDFTVANLNTVLEKCLALPKEPPHTQEGNDPLWHARKGKDVSFLLQHLDIIVKSLNCVDEVAPFRPVPADQLFRKRSKSSSKGARE